MFACAVVLSIPCDQKTWIEESLSADTEVAPPNAPPPVAVGGVVSNVVVDETLRGTGLGKQIMAATLQAAWDRGCYKAMLMTGSKTPATHSFYRSCGFSPDAKTAYLARP